MKDDQLDPHLKAMLATAAAAPAGPSIRDLPVSLAREAYRERYLVRGLQAPANAVAMEERVFDLPGRQIAARLYRPGAAAAATALPLVVYFHGGGFVVGDPAAYDNQSRWLADRLGAAVLTPDYRLAPEHPFPAAVHDAWDIYTAVAAEPAAWGADPARIAVAGDSAGGCLALVCALMARDRPTGPQPVACMPLYPVTDYRTFGNGPGGSSIEAFGKGYFLDTATLDWFCNLYFTDAGQGNDPRASPLFWPEVTGLPPVILATAGYDPLRDQGDAMAERLATAGGIVEHVRLPAMIHNFPGYAAISPGAAEAFAQVADRLAPHLRPQR